MNYIRELIRAVRAKRPSQDELSVRMLRNHKVGTSQVRDVRGQQ
jgi:hypothetical protein